MFHANGLLVTGLTGADLMLHLARDVAERAALPKAVIFVDTMPLTALGKIDKAELRRRETRWALQHALAAAGVTPRAVGVDSSGVAKIELESEQSLATAREVVARFSFRCDFV